MPFLVHERGSFNSGFDMIYICRKDIPSIDPILFCEAATKFRIQDIAIAIAMTVASTFLFKIIGDEKCHV